MSDFGYNIRDARPEELDAIHQIELRSFPDPYPRGLLKAFFFIPGSIIVAESKNRIVGYAIGVIREDHLGHIVSIAVAENERRRGMGSALLKGIITKLSRMNAKKLVLEVRKSNYEAKSLYQKFGFEKKKEIRGYYQDGETAEVMELTL
ncbi:MAG: ribosomal protein S18-alanine N-acetyltransferase [Candidatus Methanosuratus sp.]|nr:ribosomal protein S18-alanine N-acetyltransferase [Candidatus Methanosuratincola sp.]